MSLRTVLAYKADSGEVVIWSAEESWARGFGVARIEMTDGVAGAEGVAVYAIDVAGVVEAAEVTVQSLAVAEVVVGAEMWH